ncbi:MAG: hypothetical protein NC429_12055 [Lachnospiraceae bacterium]|nr:hypothetical protein [Lachnospiraceae bacterium]
MAEGFGQKKRTRPIKITDIAISKVPRMELSGFSEDENLFMQEQHKRLLSISKEKNGSREVGILVDIVHWDTWVIMGEANEIETRSNPDAYKAMKSSRKNTMMFMHNHPSTGTFSGTDFKTFCLNDSLYIMTVVGNDGNVRVLTKLNGFDGREALIYYSDLATRKYKDYKNNGTMAMRELLKNSVEIKLKYETGGK